MAPERVDTMVDVEDHDLLLAAKGGSRAALGTIFDRYWQTAWRAAYGVTHNRELADDAAQDAFVRAAKALGKFDHSRPFAPWIAKIAVNRAIDLVRREAPLTSLDDFPAEMSSSPDRDEDLHAAVAALPEDRRIVVVLHFLLGFTLEEMAAILDIPAGTAASRLSRAIGSLRNALEDAHRV